MRIARAISIAARVLALSFGTTALAQESVQDSDEIIE